MGNLKLAGKSKTVQTSWRRFILKGKLVWVKVTAQGRFVLRPGATVEVRYDENIFKPRFASPSNLRRLSKAEMDCIELSVTTDERKELILKASKHVANKPGTSLGRGGSRQIWDVGVALINGFALSVDESLYILFHEYNPRCDLPWPENELRKRLTSISQGPKDLKGYLLDNIILPRTKAV